MDMARLIKVLTLSGSPADGEALAALRTAQRLVVESGGSWTDFVTSLARRAVSEMDNKELHSIIKRLRGQHLRLKAQLQQLRASQVAEPVVEQVAAALSHSRAAIAAEMRRVFADPDLAKLADRELSRRIGLSPTTIGNWRRRLASTM
jgi:hypothetical protein